MEQMIEQCTQMMKLSGTGMMNGMMGSTGMMGGMMSTMAFGMLLGVALLIIGIMLLLRWLTTRNGNRTGDALAILQERFARGDIGVEEYQERRSILLNH